MILIESLVILLSMIAFYIIGVQNKNLHPEFLINFIFIVLLVSLFIFRSGSIRHMYLGFVLLLLAVFASVFGFNDFLYILSSLALSLLILGIINMLLFTKEDK